MRKFLPAALALALTLCTALPTQAQEQEDPGELATLVSVWTMTVAPGDAAQFEAGMLKFVEASQQAEIPEMFRVDVYQEDDRYLIVTFPENMASFDDEGAFMRRFAGTAGEATLLEAYGLWEGLDVSIHSMIHRTNLDWTYLPPGGWAPTHSGIAVIDNWAAPGQDEALDENSKRIAAALAKMEYPYPVVAHSTMIGDQGMYHWVIFHDGLANYHGDHNIEVYLEKAGMFEEWGAIFQERAPLMRKIDSYEAMYRPDLSYRP